MIHPACGRLYETIKVTPEVINQGKLLGQGANADVYAATFDGQEVAVKVFRNAKEEVGLLKRGAV